MYDSETQRSDQTAVLPAYSWHDRTISQIALGLTFGAVMLSGFVFGLRVSPIIDEMSFPLKSILFAWGVLFGGLVVISAPSQRTSNVVRAVLTVLSGLCFVADGEAIREAYVFAGVPAQAVQVLAPIARSSDCHGRYSRPKLNVEPYPGITLPIKTTRKICETYDNSDLNRHECVRLEVETGKYGIRRMVTPLSIDAC